MLTPVQSLNRMARMVRELRRSHRYQIAALVFASWRSPEGKLLKLVGVTRDLSMHGISFLAPAPIEVGTHVELDVCFPVPNKQGKGLTLHGEGTILRVEQLSAIETQLAAEVLFDSEPEATILSATLVQ